MKSGVIDFFIGTAGCGRGAEAFAPPRGSGPVEATQPPVNDNLPGGGTVKPEYARSGQWIRKPGT